MEKYFKAYVQLCILLFSTSTHILSPTTCILNLLTFWLKKLEIKKCCTNTMLPKRVSEMCTGTKNERWEITMFTCQCKGEALSKNEYLAFSSFFLWTVFVPFNILVNLYFLKFKQLLFQIEIIYIHLSIYMVLEMNKSKLTHLTI